jgi:hypothetical protein
MTEKGLGKVYRGKDSLADVRYEIQIENKFQRVNTLNGSGVVPDFSVARMRIDGAEEIDAQWNDRLTLHMADGRKWNFFLSPDGSCKPTGGPYK